MGACVADLVDVGLGLKTLNADVGNILCLLDPSQLVRYGAEGDELYLHGQVCVHQDLEFKVLLTLIGDLEGGSERILGQSDAVH